MNSNRDARPLVPGDPAIPDYSSGYGNDGAGGAKNTGQRHGYHLRKRQPLALVTHNVHTLRLDEKLVELEEEMDKLRWDIVRLSEIRRQGEDTITLQSGHLFFYRVGEQKFQGGVGFTVHKSFMNNIVSFGSVSNRAACLILRTSKRYSLKVIQVYAPTDTPRR